MDDGHIEGFSFHENQNYTAGGEGGATLINDRTSTERAEYLHLSQKGTNRSQFFRGQVDKYTGGISAPQLFDVRSAGCLYICGRNYADRINQQRLSLWQTITMR